MKRIIQIYVSKGEEYYVAQGLDLPIVTQAKTLDELAKNVQEAINLHLEGEDPAHFDFSPDPSILMNFELPAQLHV